MRNSDVLKSIAQKAKRRLVGLEILPSSKIKVISSEDEEFKSKVEMLLAQEDVVSNPVHYLMDDKLFAQLDTNAKERYLLSTLDKYNSLKNKLENNNNISKFCM